MIDIGKKPDTRRIAVAQGVLRLKQGTAALVREGRVEKGNALETARAAGLLAIKQAPHLIPHCHPIPITKAGITFDVQDDSVTATCTVETIGKTGCEMDALVGCGVALITLLDMVKKYEKEDDYANTRLELRIIKKEKHKL
jgi:cyclic pyranopterin phosphate synthase